MSPPSSNTQIITALLDWLWRSWISLGVSGHATAGEIARRSGFTARSVLLPLREIALSGHLHEPPRPARNRSQRGQPAPARTRGPSLAYALRPEEWNFLRTWEEPSGFPELALDTTFRNAMCGGVMIARLATSMKRSSKSSLTQMAMQALEEAVAKVIEEHRRRGIPLAVWRNGKAVSLPASEAATLRESPPAYRTLSREK